jgi:hypothetical protein
MHINRHSPDSCRVGRQFAPFPRGAGCRWDGTSRRHAERLKIAEFSVIEAHFEAPPVSIAATLTTTAFDDRSLQWFEACA